MKLSKDVVVELMLNGFELQYKNVSISSLGDKLYVGSKRRNYQVHCDYYHLKFSEIYSDVEIAADKFVALKGQLDVLYAQNRRDYESKKTNRSVSELPAQSTE